AGYLSAQLDGLGVPERLARANACGALACTVPGDWEGAPRRQELEALLADGPADPVSRRGGEAPSRRDGGSARRCSTEELSRARRRRGGAGAPVARRGAESARRRMGETRQH